MDKKIAIVITAILITITVIGYVYYFGSYNYGSQEPTNTASDQSRQPANNPAASEQPQVDVMVTNNPAFGEILTDGNGMTLYTYSKDTKDTSTCYGTCAVNWPPLLVKNDPKIASDLIVSKFNVITRTDGGKQIAFKGMPLYYWIKDAKPGDATGQDVGGVWFVYKVGADDLSKGSAPSSNTK